MKVSDLLESTTKKLANGAYYKPTYSKFYGGKIRGSVSDWLEAMGVSKEDVHDAYYKVQESPEYQAILDLGMSDESSDRELKNGTLNFIGHIDELTYGIGKRAKTRVRYKVLANGKIDAVSGNDYNRYDLPVPKPTVVVGNPVQTVVKTMTNALKRLHEILSKRIEKGKKAIQR